MNDVSAAMMCRRHPERCWYVWTITRDPGSGFSGGRLPTRSGYVATTRAS